MQQISTGLVSGNHENVAHDLAQCNPRDPALATTGAPNSKCISRGNVFG